MADIGEFPYPLDAMSMFALRVAPVDVHRGHVKDLPSLPLPFCPPSGDSRSLFHSVFQALSIFFYMLTHKSSLLLCCSSGAEKVSSKGTS